MKIWQSIVGIVKHAPKRTVATLVAGGGFILYPGELVEFFNYIVSLF